MSKITKSVNSKPIHVIANLVATYDLSPADANSVSSIDYLCVYEYEYEGKKYEYRTHQRDNFSPIPEIIELGFVKDPNKVYKVNKVNNSSQRGENKSSYIIFFVFIFGGLSLAIYLIYNIVKHVISSELNIFSLLIIIGLFIIAIINGLKKQKKGNNRDAMIEAAMINNRTATAYLTKTTYISHTQINSSEMQQYYKEHSYEGKYKYEYNGKKYTTTLVFSSSPPSSVRLFLGKNPRDIIHFTR